MPLLHTPAIVLRVNDHGDSDKIITLYSEAYGKIVLIAKGAKRSKKRFLNKLELFSHLDVWFAPSRRGTLLRLEQAELVGLFPRLREDYRLYAAASLLCEFVLQWTREQDSEGELFALLLWALQGLAGNDPGVERLIISFHLKLLDIVGYRPDLSACLDCRTLGASRRVVYRFNPMRNGLVCSRCDSLAKSDQQLSLQTVRSLCRAQDMALEKIERLQFPPQVSLEALAMLKGYDSHLLQREAQSWSFLF